MPTTATSNQMYERVVEFLGHRYPQHLVNVHLVHSQAKLDEQAQAFHLAAISDDDEDSEEGRIAAMTWFLPRKRTLLAPFAVGTVDQALMSVLQTKHFFVRLFGLNNKTVLFDEVHAYDTYMETLFQRLLAWLAAAGTSVIVLSATLPAKTRRELVAAYTGNKRIELPQTPYPCLTWTDSGDVSAIALPAPPQRHVAMRWIGREPEAIAGTLRDKLEGGGCAAVICNTVGRAQDVYETLKNSGVVPDDNLTLFHARFPAGWRKEIEDKVVERFRKKGQRPERAIVVATQVIEQSLDLDFDVMVSDLAPVDLVLQRVGRLHRHPDNVRPPGLAAPTLFITKPALQETLPVFEGDAYIYEPYILLRSYLALRDKAQLDLPTDTPILIEQVYDATEPDESLNEPWRSALVEAAHTMENEQRGAMRNALGNLIRKPEDERLFSDNLLALEEDNPDVHQALQALTRLIEPGGVDCVPAPNTSRSGARTRRNWLSAWAGCTSRAGVDRQASATILDGPSPRRGATTSGSDTAVRMGTKRRASPPSSCRL
ncbi:MAG: CRISPR-associated helicase Cas3' [Anaerolineae bacterium]|nr:CRISPR-associated helicase Cas3' [Anaerolineae bacterium]